MSKIKIVASSQEFLSVVEKSGLLAGNELEFARKACAETDDPKTAARKLLSSGALTHWQVSQMLAGFAGLVTGKYELLDVIGKGDFGRVYLAEHVTMGQKVALKTLSTKNVTDPAIIERFLADAQASSMFEHRNVVRVLDVSSEHDRHYVATEYLSGGDLQQLVEKQGPLPPRDCAEYVAQAADGLAYVHGKGVLHRGLKPANLLLNDKGVLKLLDVGVGQLRQAPASAADSSGNASAKGLEYVSPEQARGKDVDIRSDIYSLGAVFYFLLTGRDPYSANSDDERQAILQSKQPIPISRLRTDAPPDLVRLCEEMMSPRPADRPASMEEISRRLRSYLSHSEEVDLTPASLDESLAVNPHDSPIDLSFADAGMAETDAPKAASPHTSKSSEAASSEAAASKAARTPAPDVSSTPAAKSPPPAAAEAKPPAAEKPKPVHDTVKISDTASILESFVVAESSDTDSEESAEEDEPVVVINKGGSGSAAEKPVKGADAPVPGLKIQTKPKERTVVADPAVTGGISPLAQAKAKRQKQRLIMLTASIGALILLGVFALVASSVMNSSSGEVAEGDSKKSEAKETATSAAGAAPTADAPPANPAPAVVTAPATTLPAATPPASPTNPVDAATASTPAGSPVVSPATPVAGGTGAETAAPASPAGATPLGSTPPATPAPASPAKPDDTKSAEKTDVPPATSKPDTAKPDTAKPDPAPEKKPETPPESKPEPKPEMKPAPASSDTPKDVATATPAAKVFDLEPAVDLPPLPAAGSGGNGEAAATVIGRIHLAAKDDCFISMFGGEHAMKGKGTFSIRSGQGGTAPRDWEFYLAESADAETIIANLSLRDNELKFGWTDEGAKNALSTYLRNCAIRIRAGKEKPFTVAFRKAQLDAPPSLAGLEKSPITLKFNLEALPDASKLRIDPRIPNMKTVFESEGQHDPTKGEHWLCFGETKDKSVLRVKVATSVTARGIQLTMSPHIARGNEKPQRLTPALLRTFSIPAMMEQKKNLEAMKAELDKTPKEKAGQVAGKRDQLAIDLKNLDTGIQSLTQLEETMKALSGATLNLRVYYDAVEAKVDLIRAGDIPAEG